MRRTFVKGPATAVERFHANIRLPASPARLLRIKSVVSLAVVFTLTANTQEPALSFQSGEQQTALVELYTSEGCSSCPPAERWFTGLKRSGRLWKEFVPVAFHVDYWDYLGWRDPWGSKPFSDRQRDYAALWRTESIYTPGFVLNGHEWRALLRPQDGPPSSGHTVGALRVTSTDSKEWQVSFSPAGQDKGNYRVNAALLACGLASDVKAGENQGRRLEHDFIVTAMTSSSLTNSGPTAEGDFKLESSRKSGPGRLAVAVWVTSGSNLQPIQATGGWLTH